jgi:hypothetical protein
MDIIKMTVEQALEFTVNHTRGSTFSPNSWDAKTAMLVMAKEIESLRQQLTKPADDTISVSKAELTPVAVFVRYTGDGKIFAPYTGFKYRDGYVAELGEKLFTESQLKAEVERAESKLEVQLKINKQLADEVTSLEMQITRLLDNKGSESNKIVP